MRHAEIAIAMIGIAVAAGAGGIAAAAAVGGPPTPGASPKAASDTALSVAPSVTSATSVTINTADASVAGKTESILVDGQRVRLHIYRPDTATTSFLTGGRASLWPPLESTHPTVVGVPGRLSVTRDASGSQVAYNGHFRYTFVSDSAGHVTGQGVQSFFVATPGMAPIGASSAPTDPSSTPVPASRSGSVYGY